jgi:hypothetical protein
MKIISAATEIGAPPMTIWTVLTDLGSYPEWNPLFREASGEIAVGNLITLRSVHPANGRMMTVKPKIVVAEPGVELRWSAGLPGIIGGEHSFALTPRNGGTLLVQSESFRGLLAPFSRRTMANTSTGFRELNEALKKRVEAG